MTSPIVAPDPGLDLNRIDQFSRLCDFTAHVMAGKCVIKDKSTGMLGPLVLNAVQTQFLAIIMQQAATCPRCLRLVYEDDSRCPACSTAGSPVYRGVPGRVITAKARKMGISSVAQHIADFFAKHYEGYRALTVAHTAPETANIFKIALIAHYDGTPPANAPRGIIETAHGSTYECRTGGGRFVASGGTYDFLHISELAKFAREAMGGVSGGTSDAEAVISLLNSVPLEPYTLVIIESTGMGPIGEFYERCMHADKGIGDYALAFFPWFMDEGYRKQPPLNWIPTDDDEDVRAEVKAQAGVELDDQQIFWRHTMLTSEAAAERGSVREMAFKREYPSILSDCFSAMEGRVYPTFRESKHCGTLDLKPYIEWMATKGNNWDTMGLMRGVDVGYSIGHAFVTLWVAFDNTKMPQLLVNRDDPGCAEFCKEMQLYTWHPKLDEPLKKNDHGPDCLRYLITSARLRGLVYIYRAKYIWGLADIGGPEEAARIIHEMSGWQNNGDPSVLTDYEPVSDGETYTQTICDKAAKGTISAFNQWGIPTVPYRDPERPNIQTGAKRETVKDGIQEVATLLSGTAWIEVPKKDTHADLVKSALEADHCVFGRPRRLTVEEEDALIKEDQKHRSQQNRGGLSVFGPGIM